MNDQFVGFGTSTDWLQAINRDGPVNVECVTEISGNGSYGIRSATQYVILTQVKDGEVLYFLDPVDRYSTQDSRPMFDEEKHIQRAKSAFDATLAWLKEQGIFNARRAMVAMPKNLRRLEGTADYMRWNKEADLYEVIVHE